MNHMIRARWSRWETCEDCEARVWNRRWWRWEQQRVSKSIIISTFWRLLCSLSWSDGFSPCLWRHQVNLWSSTSRAGGELSAMSEATTFQQWLFSSSLPPRVSFFSVVAAQKATNISIIPLLLSAFYLNYLTTRLWCLFFFCPCFCKSL